EYIDTFFSEALPILKQVSPIEIDEKMSKEIIEFPLKAELYLEEKDFTIIGKLNYHYGEYAIDPFSPREKTEAIIIRDIQKEQAIMHLIEQSNFHYNGKELYVSMYDDDALYEFLYGILPMLEEHVDLFLTDSIKKMLIMEDPIPSATVQVEARSEEHTSELQSRFDLVCRLL